MRPGNLTVQYGELHDLIGPWRQWEGIAIAAAHVRLAGQSWTPTHPLTEHVAARHYPFDVRAMLLNGNDAPWVRGRVERLLGVPPTRQEDRGEKSGLAAGFIAAVPQDDGSRLGVPFHCADYYLHTELEFAGAVPATLANDVAAAFWNLLLDDPHDLPDYVDKLMHLGAGIWLLFGIEDGQPFVQECRREPNLNRRRRR
jgi:hypothetical protein